MLQNPGNDPNARTNKLVAVVSADEAINAVIQADGNLGLAAERLRTSKPNLIAALASDPTSTDILATAIRTSTLLHTYQIANLLNLTLQAVLADLSPDEVRKAHTATVQLLATLTQAATANTNNTNIDVTQVVLKMLPADIRKAVVDLVDTVDN